MADLPDAPQPPANNNSDDDRMRDALERANENLTVAGEELQATLQLLQERTERMHACDAILHAVLSETTAILVGVDPDGRIEAWSRGADEHFASSAEEALGRRLSEFIEGDAGEVMAAVRSLLQEETLDTDERVVESDGVMFRIRSASDFGRGLVVIDLET